MISCKVVTWRNKERRSLFCLFPCPLVKKIRDPLGGWNHMWTPPNNRADLTCCALVLRFLEGPAGQPDLFGILFKDDHWWFIYSVSSSHKAIFSFLFNICRHCLTLAVQMSTRYQIPVHSIGLALPNNVSVRNISLKLSEVMEVQSVCSVATQIICKY